MEVQVFLAAITYRKKQRRYEAEQAARPLLINLERPGVKDSPKIFADTPFIQYLYAFWFPGSEYIREAAIVRKEASESGDK